MKRERKDQNTVIFKNVVICIFGGFVTYEFICIISWSFDQDEFVA